MQCDHERFIVMSHHYTEFNLALISFFRLLFSCEIYTIPTKVYIYAAVPVTFYIFMYVNVVYFNNS